MVLLLQKKKIDKQKYLTKVIAIEFFINLWEQQYGMTL